eukprot:1145479-Pelagomonas_calceolata.AAC.2
MDGPLHVVSIDHSMWCGYTTQGWMEYGWTTFCGVEALNGWTRAHGIKRPVNVVWMHHTGMDRPWVDHFWWCRNTLPTRTWTRACGTDGPFHAVSMHHTHVRCLRTLFVRIWRVSCEGACTREWRHRLSRSSA